MIIIRHPKVTIDKTKPVDKWELSKEGKEQLNLILNQDFKKQKLTLTSPEPKAKYVANKIAKKYNIPIKETNNLKEVDRSKQGFIEGDYKEVVKKYLTKNNFQYAWEDKDQVKKRIYSLLNEISNNNTILIGHGMHFSLMLHEYYNQEITKFWKSLEFGQVLNVHLNLLKQKLFKHHHTHKYHE